MDRVTATMLLDYYGGLLTEKQQALCDRYYNQDLNFSEIAELEGISRQAVRDAVTKAESTLRNYEEKTGYFAREQKLRKALAVIELQAEQLLTLGQPAKDHGKVILDALNSVSESAGKETEYGI